MTHQQLTALAKSYLYAFPKFASNLQCPIHIKFLADKIQEKIEDKSNKFKLLMISLPPRHGKSLLISKHAVPWYLGNNPTKRVILTSYSAELANENSDFAKGIFAKWGPVLWNIHPSKSLYNRDAWNTSEGGGCISSGVGGSITGFGADLFIIDDYFKNEEESESQSTRDKLWEKWKAVILTRLHPGALVIIFATRWNDDDLIGRILNETALRKDNFSFDWEYINLPAIAEDDPKKPDPLKRKPGEALWPWRFDEDLLKDIENESGPYWWNALYQGRPSKRGGNLFKSQNFRYYTIEGLTSDYLCWRVDEEIPIRVKPKDLKIVVIVDPAMDIKKKNDPCGMLAWGYSAKQKIWLLIDRFNDKIEHQRISKLAKNFAYKNNASYILVENEKLGKIIVKDSAGKDKIGNKKIPFKEVPTKGIDKYTRAVPMATYCENERVFFPKNAPWLIKYEQNIKSFPSGGHDEDADLTAYASTMEDKISIAEILASR